MKIAKRIGIGLLVLLGLVIILYFACHIDQVKVEGSGYYTEEEVRDTVLARRFSDNSIVLFFYQKIYGTPSLPFIEQIQIVYNSPRKITLQVYDKTISGCIKYMGQYIYFDKKGIVLETLPEKRPGVPEVLGVEFGDFAVGEKVSTKDPSIFGSIMNLSQLITHYNLEVSAIKFQGKDVILKVGKVKVFLGKQEIYDDAIANLSAVMQQAKKEDLELEGVAHMENYKSGDMISIRKEQEPEKTNKKDKNKEKKDKNKKKEKDEKEIEEQDQGHMEEEDVQPEQE